MHCNPAANGIIAVKIHSSIDEYLRVLFTAPAPRASFASFTLTSNSSFVYYNLAPELVEHATFCDYYNVGNRVTVHDSESLQPRPPF